MNNTRINPDDVSAANLINFVFFVSIGILALHSYNQYTDGSIGIIGLSFRLLGMLVALAIYACKKAQ